MSLSLPFFFDPSPGGEGVLSLSFPLPFISGVASGDDERVGVTAARPGSAEVDGPTCCNSARAVVMVMRWAIRVVAEDDATAFCRCCPRYGSATLVAVWITVSSVSVMEPTLEALEERPLPGGVVLGVDALDRLLTDPGRDDPDEPCELSASDDAVASCLLDDDDGSC